VTTLHITETITYRIKHDGTPRETIRAFLRNPNEYLIAIEEREIIIEDEMTREEEIIAYWTPDSIEEISDGEMSA